jgi:ATP-binding cassette subfamily C protein
MLTGYIFDAVIPEGNRFQAVQTALALVAVSLSMAAFQIVRSIALIRIEGRMNTTIQAAIMDRLLNMPVSFFRKYTAGDLALRINGINTIRQVISGIVVLTVMNGIFSLFNLGLIFFYQINLALLALGMALTGMAFGTAIIRLSVRYRRESIEAEGTLSGMVLQFIAGMSKLRVAGAEVNAFSTWADKFAGKKRADMKTGLLLNSELVFSSTFPVICSMLIFLVTSILIKEGATTGKTPLSVGDFLALNAAFATFLSAMLQMTLSFLPALAIVPLYERALPVLHGTPEVTQKKSDPGELSGNVEINHVTFRYIQDGPLVLRDVSIRVQPGEFVAIVGPSGSGKSTLLRLLLGFERPENGAVYYDGRNLDEMDVQSVRRQVGVVLQSGTLTSGSIFDNIVGSMNMKLSDAWEAARMAGLDKDIEQMPMQMQTVISEGGGTLSGGQRQRLLIARALIRKPRIIYFDEATSALDNQTQGIVSQSLQNLSAARIVIAHRLSTIMHADRIIVMQSGQVVEEGTYRELVEKDGLFAALAKRQIF